MSDTAALFEPLSPEELAGAESARSEPTETPIIPVPDDAPPMQFRHPELGEPTSSWAYHDVESRLVAYVCRWDFLDEAGEPDKLVLPVTFCDLEAGRRGWRAKGVREPRPLLNLPELVARPEAWVLVCEGEKAANAGAHLFPDMVATTPMHGAKSPDRTDFSPCAGRIVVISTDADDAGRAFGDVVCALARAAGAAQVFHLDPQRLGAWIWRDGARVSRAGPLPKGWDLADATAEGWTAESVATCRTEPAFFVEYPGAAGCADPGSPRDDSTATDDVAQRDTAAHPWPFRVGHDEVYRRVEDQAGNVDWVWFCSRLEVVADTRNAEGEDWGRLLRMIDRDERVHQWPMPMELLAGSGEEYRRRLLPLGLVLSPAPGARRWLAEYIQTAQPEAKARCVSRVGWHGRAFVLPDRTFGETDGETVLLQTTVTLDHAFRSRGTLGGWQDRVAGLALGNSRLVLALSSAFAAPLLRATGAESGGFHFLGPSSTGKTTASVVAGSAWGGGGLKGYTRQWRATDNGLEAVAAAHCDCLLVLDELSQVDAKAAGQAAYMLANGAGKARAGRGGEGRPPHEWRVLFLSNGELGLADKLAEDGRGRRVTAGQQVRVVDIPGDAGAGLGVFETLHGFPAADAFARNLVAACADEFGTAAPAFLEAITADLDGVAAAVAEHRSLFVGDHCPPDADGQVTRVAARFGLVAAAGEIAIATAVLPWEPGEAMRGVVRCFRDWLAARGGIGPAEVAAGIAQVRAFLERHGTSRFEPFGDDAPRRSGGEPIDLQIRDRAGFRRRAPDGDGTAWEYFILAETWRHEVCSGVDADVLARELASRALLIPAKDRRLAKSQHIPGYGRMRLYHVTAAILDGGDRSRRRARYSGFQRFRGSNRPGRPASRQFGNAWRWNRGSCDAGSIGSVRAQRHARNHPNPPEPEAGPKRAWLEGGRFLGVAGNRNRWNRWNRKNRRQPTPGVGRRWPSGR